LKLNLNKVLKVCS